MSGTENNASAVLHVGRHDCYEHIYAVEGAYKLTVEAVIRCPCGRAWRLQRGTGLLRWIWSDFHLSRYGGNRYWFPAPPVHRITTTEETKR